MPNKMIPQLCRNWHLTIKYTGKKHKEVFSNKQGEKPLHGATRGRPQKKTNQRKKKRREEGISKKKKKTNHGSKIN